MASQSYESNAAQDIIGGIPIVGGLISGIIGAAFGKGKKVVLPQFKQLDPDVEQQKTISGNIANFSGAAQLASMINSLNQDQLMQVVRRAIPGYDSLTKGSSDVIQRGLRGELPEGVANQVVAKSASRALAGGFGGSRASEALTARDLGLNSYQVTQQALSDAGRFISTLRTTSVAPIVGPESMFLTPQQRISAVASSNASQYQAASASAIAQAQPSPSSASFSSFMTGLGGSLYGYGMSGGGFGGSGGSNYGPSNYNLLGSEGYLPSEVTPFSGAPAVYRR